MLKLHQKHALLTIIGLLIIACGGCGQATTQYYFAAANLDDATKKPKVTFYRITFKGSSFGAKTNVQQGFYDADALHDLFGEVKQPSPNTANTHATAQPGGATATPPPPMTTGTFQLQYDPASQEWLVVNKERFTILYGANADALASQIKMFADNNQLGQDIGQIITANLATGKKPAAKPPAPAKIPPSAPSPAPPSPPAPAPVNPPQADQLKAQVQQAQAEALILASELTNAAQTLSLLASSKADDGSALALAMLSLRQAAQSVLTALNSKVAIDPFDPKNPTKVSTDLAKAQKDLKAAK